MFYAEAETDLCAEVAQSVEQRTENPCVAGSIPALGKLFQLNSLQSYRCAPPAIPVQFWERMGCWGGSLSVFCGGYLLMTGVTL
jgi:hypothetical protein